MSRLSMMVPWLAFACSIAIPGQDQPPVPSIRWEVDPSGSTLGVSVVGLSPDAVPSPDDPAWSPERRANLFSISIESGNPDDADRPGMLGTYRVEGNSLRFTPRYPFDRGRTYLARYRPSLLSGKKQADLVSTRLIPKLVRAASVVTQVTPTADHLPENLLKFYLYFSQPMSRGEVYDRVRLLKPDGQVVSFPFLRLAEELWDPTGTRLTLLIDPGRIKRGLRPREEHGPVLEAGKSYTLVIDRGWLDAEGEPLGQEFRKTFRVEAPDEIQPDPKTWKVRRPTSLTREPLTITFPEPLDRALIESGLTLVDAKGEPVDGKLAIEASETQWVFRPDQPWLESDYQLQIETDLEDLAGNSIHRPFEVDVQRDTPTRPEPKTIRLPVLIRAKGP